MKKRIAALFVGCALLLPCGLAACGNGGENPPSGDGTAITDSKTYDYLFGEMYGKGELFDTENGFSKKSDVKSGRCYVDGNYVSSFRELKRRQDVKIELSNQQNTRFVNASAGAVFTLPTKEYSVDYSIAQYRTKIEYADSVFTVSYNSKNPYMNGSTPWYTYNSEWLIFHLNNDDYITSNGMERLNGTKAYPFTQQRAVGDVTTKPDYDLYRYDIRIDDSTNTVEYPYYNIAIVRRVKDEKTFALLVMKSKTDRAAELDKIVKSFSFMPKQGVEKNYFDAGKPVGDENWNEETKAYYDMILDTEKVHWGVFSYSMPGNEESLVETSPGYQAMLGKSKRMKEGIEEAWDYDFDIYPTYTHIGAGSDADNYAGHHFPLKMANELAGGNGFNGKPVLQFTFQYTLNNNNVRAERTPMFDILRGKFDEYFHRLARDIKTYGKPVLFRLNNEMNTDWTSYCGIMTLCDPDIFNETWIRLYKIFEEEGVDNCIWIWNPAADSCPYSSWGEDLCYYPGNEYVHLLGGTNYEMNNYDANEAATSIQSFQARYKSLYEKNLPVFSQWPMIISEFACGSGGNSGNTELGRNRSEQAKWVKEMFEAFAAEERAPWAKTIKGAVWFNCNDYDADEDITNRLRLYDPDSTDYADLSETMTAFREGFKLLKK